MKMKWMAALLLAMGATSPAFADDATVGLNELPGVEKLSSADLKPTLLLAENETGTASDATPAAADDSGKYGSQPFITGNNLHLVLGLGSLASAMAAAATAPDTEGQTAAQVQQNRNKKGFHHYAAYTAAALGGAAVASGLINHWDDFNLSDGLLDPDNLHVLLGLIGTAGYVIAVSKAPGNGHPGYGIAGGAAMVTAIAMTW